MTIHGVLGSLWTMNNCIEVPPVVVSINCMVLPSPRRIYEVILDSYHQHKSFDDPYQIYYLQKMPRPTHSRDAFAELQELVNEDLPTKKASKDDRAIVGRKRQKRTSETDRGMIVVFLDELDSLITKVGDSWIPLLIVFPLGLYPDKRGLLLSPQKPPFDTRRSFQFAGFE